LPGFSRNQPAGAECLPSTQKEQLLVTLSKSAVQSGPGSCVPVMGLWIKIGLDAQQNDKKKWFEHGLNTRNDQNL